MRTDNSIENSNTTDLNFYTLTIHIKMTVNNTKMIVQESNLDILLSKLYLLNIPGKVTTFR